MKPFRLAAGVEEEIQREIPRGISVLLSSLVGEERAMVKSAIEVFGLVLLLGLTPAGAQDPPVKFDSAGEKAALDKYLKETRKAATRYLKDLAREMKRSLKAGDLEEAKQIEAEQQRISDILDRSDSSKRKPGLPVPPLPKAQAAALKAWKRLPGVKVEIQSTSPDAKINMVLRLGLVVQIIPRPGDTWATSKNRTPADPLKGHVGIPMKLQSGETLDVMQLLVWVGDGPKHAVNSGKIYEGAGAVHLGAADGTFSDNKGAIWVKVLLGRKPK